MAKYIDADTVVSMPFLDDSYGIEKHTVETDTIENLLDRFTKEGCPEPANVARVIHCRNCRYFRTHTCMDSMPIEICDLDQTFYDPDRDFCSLAESREE
jgi:hypothetical protein